MKIPAVAMECLSLGGIGNDGQPFTKELVVPAGGIQVLWGGVQVPPRPSRSCSHCISRPSALFENLAAGNPGTPPIGHYDSPLHLTEIRAGQGPASADAWLVSSPDTAGAKPVTPASGNSFVTLLDTGRESSTVRVPSIPLDQGACAWWTADESKKALVNLADPHKDNANTRNFSLAAAQDFDFETHETQPPAGKPLAGHTTAPAREIESTVTVATAALLPLDNPDAFQDSLADKLDADSGPAGLDPQPPVTYFQSATFSAPGYVRDLTNVSTPAIQPVVVEASLGWDFSPNPSRDRTETLRGHLYPRLILWNPFNVTLMATRYVVLLRHPSYGAFVCRGERVNTRGDRMFFNDVSGSPEAAFCGFVTLPTEIGPGETKIFTPDINASSGTKIAGKAAAFDSQNYAANVLTADQIPGGENSYYDTNVVLPSETPANRFEPYGFSNDLNSFFSNGNGVGDEFFVAQATGRPTGRITWSDVTSPRADFPRVAHFLCQNESLFADFKLPETPGHCDIFLNRAKNQKGWDKAESLILPASDAAFPTGSFRLVNLSDMPVKWKIDNEIIDLAPRLARTVRPARTGLLIPVQAAHPAGEGFQIILQSGIRLAADQRANLIVYPGRNPKKPCEITWYYQFDPTPETVPADE